MHRVPKVGRHSSGQARVTLSGQVFYLGEFGSPEAATKYAELLARWEAGGRKPLRAVATVAQLGTFAELVKDRLQFLDQRGKYRMTDGRVTSARLRLGRMLGYAVEAIGDVQLRRLRPTTIRQMVDAFVARKTLGRETINKALGRIRDMLEWATQNERIERNVMRDLQDALRPIKRDDLPHRDRKVDKFVPTLKQVSAVAAAAGGIVGRMIEVQFSAGMRPTEMLEMRWCDLDRTGETKWIYKVRSEHSKTAHLGKDLPYEVQSHLLADLVPAGPAARVFADGPRDRSSYAAALAAACRRAGVPRIVPHALRHAAATETARRHGVAAAAALLNHSSVAVTARYVHAQAADRARAAADLAGLLRAQ